MLLVCNVSKNNVLAVAAPLCELTTMTLNTYFIVNICLLNLIKTDAKHELCDFIFHSDYQSVNTSFFEITDTEISIVSIHFLVSLSLFYYSEKSTQEFFVFYVSRWNTHIHNALERHYSMKNGNVNCELCIWSIELQVKRTQVMTFALYQMNDSIAP